MISHERHDTISNRKRSSMSGAPLAGCLALAAAVLANAAPLDAQKINVPDVAPLAMSAAGTPAGGAADAGSDTSSGRGPDRTRPAWVVGDVPDTVWILVEASVASGDDDQAKRILRRAEGLAREAVVGHEDNVGRRFALAAVLGMRTDVEGGRTKVGVA
ncbi:MAG: hypothetical protein R3253_13960, partial [Longimicrobiales bacterium]|nr:hypothetical protein [Longimicrobiales bacterium]